MISSNGGAWSLGGTIGQFDAGAMTASGSSPQIRDTIDAQIGWMTLFGSPWPTMEVDGFWVDFESSGFSFYGAYDHPFTSITATLSY